MQELGRTARGEDVEGRGGEGEIVEPDKNTGIGLGEVHRTNSGEHADGQPVTGRGARTLPSPLEQRNPYRDPPPRA